MVSELESVILKVLRTYYPRPVKYEQLVIEVNKVSQKELGREWNPEYICRQIRRMRKKSMVEGNGILGFRFALDKKKYMTLDQLAMRGVSDEACS